MYGLANNFAGAISLLFQRFLLIGCLTNTNYMNMRFSLSLLVLVLVFSNFQCQPNQPTPSEEQSAQCPNILWLQPYLDAFKNNPAVKSEIIRYQYNGETVYYIDSCKGCPDSMAIVYNCSGEVVCQFGGIAGFNTCPDFAETATHKKVIWSN